MTHLWASLSPPNSTPAATTARSIDLVSSSLGTILSSTAVAGTARLGGDARCRATSMGWGGLTFEGFRPPARRRGLSGHCLAASARECPPIPAQRALAKPHVHALLLAVVFHARLITICLRPPVRSRSRRTIALGCLHRTAASPGSGQQAIVIGRLMRRGHPVGAEGGAHFRSACVGSTGRSCFSKHSTTQQQQLCLGTTATAALRDDLSG